jgi:hypothetical protein
MSVFSWDAQAHGPRMVLLVTTVLSAMAFPSIARAQVRSRVQKRLPFAEV